MKLKHIIFIFIIVMLILQCSPQRGGGRSSGRSRSSRAGRSKGSGGGLISWLILGGIVGIGSLFSRSDKDRAKDLKKIFKEFQQKNESKCALDEDKRTQIIHGFMQKTFTVRFYLKNSKDAQTWTFKANNITKRTDYIYQIQAEGSEFNLGDSKITGILMFKQEKLAICFDKLYNDRKKAGQTDKWDLLVYEGYQDGNWFEGDWYYSGFKNDDKYSGKMKMIPK